MPFSYNSTPSSSEPATRRPVKHRCLEGNELTQVLIFLQSNPEFAELNKTIQSKDAELARCRKETTGYKSKLLELTAVRRQRWCTGLASAQYCWKRELCESFACTAKRTYPSLSSETFKCTVQCDFISSIGSCAFLLIIRFRFTTFGSWMALAR